MTNISYDLQFLQQTAQAQLQAALHLNSAARNHLSLAEPNSSKRHSSSSHSSEPAGDQPLPEFLRFDSFWGQVQSTNVPAAATSSVSTRSEPILDSYLPVPASTSPRPPAAGKVASPSYREPCGLSPEVKRAKRMKEGIIQMKKLWDEVIKEEEEDAASQNAHHCPHKDDCDAIDASRTEELCGESVWVERKGETRILHYKCHCNKAYKILLSGNDCYYMISSVEMTQPELVPYIVGNDLQTRIPHQLFPSFLGCYILDLL